jgi:hypothetical protein
VPIEWSKLKPYQHDKRKSFEELCFQIAKSEYSYLGAFTSIDDSGGGDGVEFYLSLPNGEEWGWQAKFYFPDKRLSSSRRASVLDSLEVSLSKHPALKKWFLCTPTNLSPNGKRSEVDWFKTDLQKIGKGVELIHWSESDFVNFLADPKLSGKRNFFFGELELSPSWFHAQVTKQLRNVGDKFIKKLHCPTYGDALVHNATGDSAFLGTLKESSSRLLECITDFERKAREKLYSIPSDSEWKGISDQLAVKAIRATNDLNTAVDAIKSIVAFVLNGDFRSAVQIDLGSCKEAFLSSSQAYFSTCEAARDTIPTLPPAEQDRTANRSSDKISDFWSVLIEADNSLTALSIAMNAFDIFKRGYLHVLADAGFGKTHLTCSMASARVENDLPAILLLGEQFGKGDTIEGRIREICDIPPSYSWADFVSALESCAEAYKTRVVIAIDALNEAEAVEIWRQQLAGFISTLGESRGVSLVTTARSSYEDQIWGPSHDGRVHLNGFEDSGLPGVVGRYFRYFKINADLTFDSIEQFRNPLYIRIFCEAVNAERKVEKEVFIGRQYVLSMFETFLQRRNESFSKRISKPPSSKVLQSLLRRFADQLWQRNARHLTFEETVHLLDEKSPEETSFNWQGSYTKALLNEELLINRDAYGDGQMVSFTYDMLGGYLIADGLLSKVNGAAAIESARNPPFIAKLTDKDYQRRHPLPADILRCYHLLLPAITGQHSYKLGVKPFYSSAISALFEMDPKYLSVDESLEIEKLFSDPQNRGALLSMMENMSFAASHPFNARFLSKLLRGLKMVERDLSWSELLRKEAGWHSDTVDALEKASRSREEPRQSGDRLKLVANYLMWMLTSTNRDLRNKVTRALYWYGRRFPASLFSLALSSLRINDPYVSERMLAASYGVCMALYRRPKRPQFEKKHSAFAKSIYKGMFAVSAPHSTTHALTRDFARRIIQLACLCDSSLLGEAELKRTVPPYKDGGIRNWKVMKDPSEGKYREGNAPLGMDFGNYTIGGLVPGRRNYQFENKEYQRVVGEIIWRIYQLGYSLESFGEIDKNIARWQGYGRAERPHVERYGKKYSWIAYFEQYGLRKDAGLLKREWREEEERSSDIDIDPSFPEEPHKLRLVEDLLGDRSGDIRSWVEQGPTPGFGSYLLRTEMLKVKGPWLLLDGHSSQWDKQAERMGFAALQSFILLEEDLEEFVSLISKEQPRGKWLPEEEEDHYTFAGEVPWCDTFSHNCLETVDFVTGTTTVKVSASDPRYNLRVFLDFGNSRRTIEPPKRPKFEQVNVYKKIPVYVPIRRNGLSVSGSAGRTSCTVPAKELAELFRLWLNVPSWNMYDESGKACSIVTAAGELRDYESLLYFRKGLIDELLSSQNLALVWVVWGERQHFGERHGMTTAPSAGYKYFRQVYRYSGGLVEKV